jgi:DHA1 family 2-module integral membrane pump EmrD-like MFS transporter
MKKPVENKTTMIVLIALMSAITQAGLVLYTPAFLQIEAAFNVTSSQVQLTLTGYLFGFGVSQLIYGPLSDRHGRKIMLLIGMIIFSAGSFWSIFTSNYSGLLLSRIIQGLGAGSCLTLSRAILRDSFTGPEYIKVATYLSSGFAFGLGVTPIIGGHLLDFFSWRSEFVFLFFSGIALFICFFVFLPETYTPQKNKQSIIRFYKETCINFLFILKNKDFDCYLVGGVLAYAVVIAFNTMAPFLFQKTLGYSASFYGWLSFSMAVSYYLGTIVNRKFMHTLSPKNMIKIGLLFIFFSGLIMLGADVLFHQCNLYVIAIPLLGATFGQALIWSNSLACALKDLSKIAGTASALFSCLQMLLSSVLSGLFSLPQQHDQTPISLIILGLPIISWIIFQVFVFRKQEESVV